MKSVIAQASSLAKAIDAAWEKAGKPAEFFTRVLQEAGSGFLGFRSQKAKVVLFFKNTEKEQAKNAFPVVLNQHEYEDLFDNNRLKNPIEDTAHANQDLSKQQSEPVRKHNPNRNQAVRNNNQQTQQHNKQQQPKQQVEKAPLQQKKDPQPVVAEKKHDVSEKPRRPRRFYHHKQQTSDKKQTQNSQKKEAHNKPDKPVVQQPVKPGGQPVAKQKPHSGSEQQAQRPKPMRRRPLPSKKNSD